MEKTFTTKLIGVTETGFPFIKVEFTDKNGNQHIGALMVDTGSCDCILSHRIVELLPDETLTDNKLKIGSIHGNFQQFQGVLFDFNIGGESFSETFYTNENTNLDYLFKPGDFVGIIGNKFLKKHGLALDYENGVLRSTNNVLAQDMSKFDFLFPLSIGMDNYELPIVAFENNGNRFVLVTDSGCNVSTMTKHVLDVSGIEAKMLDDTVSLSGLTADYGENQVAIIKMGVISFCNEETHEKTCMYADRVQILPNYNHIVEAEQLDKKNILPISGLLSTPFMARNKWILDFGAGIIYSNKQAA